MKANTKTTGVNMTTNKCGNPAYVMKDKEKLVTMVLTSFFNEAKFYGDNSAELVELADKLVANGNAEFVSNLAVFARREMNMRTISHVLTTRLAKSEQGRAYVCGTIKGVSLRGDDLTEIMAMFLDGIDSDKKTIPNQMKKGMSDVLNGMNEYHLAKYKGEKNAIKMADVIKLCHPHSSSKQHELYKRCIEGKLAVPYTWETELSTKGNTKEVWEQLINSGKVGYMALLRNLRNILNVGVSHECLAKVLATISNEDNVVNSKQLPFRYLSAYKVVSDIAGSEVFGALENAIKASFKNLPKVSGTTVIAIDVSGSMSDTLSSKSTIQYVEVAYLMGMILSNICDNTIVYTFDHRLNKLAVPHDCDVLHWVTSRGANGGWTEMALPLQEMVAKGIKADRIVYLSDNECNWGKTTIQSHADEYRRKVNHDFWVHAIDMAGYGTQQFIGDKFNLLAGWSEKVLQFISLAELGVDNLIKTIEEYNYFT